MARNAVMILTGLLVVCVWLAGCDSKPETYLAGQIDENEYDPKEMTETHGLDYLGKPYLEALDMLPEKHEALLRQLLAGAGMDAGHAESMARIRGKISVRF